MLTQPDTGGLKITSLMAKNAVALNFLFFLKVISLLRFFIHHLWIIHWIWQGERIKINTWLWREINITIDIKSKTQVDVLYISIFDACTWADSYNACFPIVDHPWDWWWLVGGTWSWNMHRMAIRRKDVSFVFVSSYCFTFRGVVHDRRHTRGEMCCNCWLRKFFLVVW